MRGDDLSLTSIAKGIVTLREKWAAFSQFCEEVLIRKEAAERERDQMAAATREGIPR